MTDTYLEDFATRLKPRQASNILLWAIIAFFLIFIAWAALTELDRTVHAQGRVIPSSRLQIVSNLEGGIIREILVKSGDMVTKGQPLVRMDKTLLGADLGTNQATVNALRTRRSIPRRRAPPRTSSCGSRNRSMPRAWAN